MEGKALAAYVGLGAFLPGSARPIISATGSIVNLLR